MSSRGALVALAVVILLATGYNTYGQIRDAERINSVVSKLKRDEHATRTTAEHVKEVQVAGGPVAVCLLDAMRAVTPLLLKVPTVSGPLSAYVELQSHRYPGVKCPDGEP
jgi:hypothetical protein